MSSQALAILIGTVCSIVLTPFVVSLWRRLAPPSPQRATELTADAWHRSDKISKESVVVTVLAGLLFGSFVGFGTVLNGVAAVMVISAVFGIPTGWIWLRTRLFAPATAIDDFARYFEQKHGVSFKSWQFVGVPALGISLACLADFLSGLS